MISRKTRWLPSVLFAVSVFLSLHARGSTLETGDIYVDGGGRGLLQSLAVSVDDAKSAKVVFGDLKPGQTINLDLKTLTLTETLNIDKAGVTIRGVSRPTVKCPEADFAISVGASNVTIEGLNFERCKDVPGVIRVADPRDAPKLEGSQVPISGILFSEVNFVNNEVTEGGALALSDGVRVKVINCTFSGNVGSKGGAIALLSGVLEVETSNFTKNTAQQSGGAISILGRGGTEEGTAVRISNCNFEGNKVMSGAQGSEPHGGPSGKPLESSQYFGFEFGAGRGGAVNLANVQFVLIESCKFEKNVASVGGAVAVVSDFTISTGQVQIVQSEFNRNKAEFVGEQSESEAPRQDEVLQGGSIYMFVGSDGVQVALGGCTITNSQAALGGGMHLVTADQTQSQFNSCKFDRNIAAKAGGGLLIRNGVVDWVNSDVTNCRAEVGGGMLITNNADMQITGPGVSEEGVIVGNSNSMFANNVAVDGGGVSCIFCGEVLFQGCHFVNNTAIRNGGGLALLDGIGSITLANYLFEKNTALQGGGMYVDTTGRVTLQTPRQFKAIGQPSVFQHNVAVAGGALLVVARSLRENVLNIEDTNFIGNQAIELPEFLGETNPLGDELLSDSLQRLDEAAAVVASAVENRKDGALALVGLLGSEQDPTRVDAEKGLSTSCGLAGGGAVCLVLNEVPPAAIVNVILFRLNFRDNKAGVGGGLFAAIDKVGWKKSAPCSAGLPSPTADPCRSFRIESTNVTGNTAVHGGGGLFISSPSSVVVKCKGDGITNLQKYWDQSMTLLEAWKSGKHKDVCINIADNVVLNNGGIFGPQIASSGQALELMWPDEVPKMKQTSGGKLSFNETNPSNGIQLRVMDAFNQTVTGALKESEADVTLKTLSNVLRGQQSYKADKGIVTINSTDVLGNHTTHHVIFSAIGLPPTNTTFEIRDCYPGEEEGKDFKECRTCGVDEYSFIPEAGCQECERDAICPGGAALAPKPGYWHSTPFAPQFHVCLILEACKYSDREEKLLEFYSDPTTLNPSNEVLGNDDYQQCAQGYKGVLCGSCEDGYGHLVGGECTKCQSRSRIGWVTASVLIWSFVVILFEIAFSMSANRDFLKGAEMSQIQRRSLSRNVRSSQEMAAGVRDGLVSGSRRSDGFQNVAPDEFIPDYVEAFESLTETGKIFVNYLQVTSLAASINASWNRVVKQILRWQELATGISNGSTNYPLDCVFLGTRSIPKSVLALWLRIMFPVFMWILYLAIIGAIWLTMRFKRMHSASDVQKYITVVTIAIAFFAYNPITEDLLRTVNCVHLHAQDDSSSKNPNANFTLAIDGRVWAEDTNLKCFNGEHTATGVVGILGLCFFSLGFIVFIIALLAFNRDKVKDEAFLSRYGFLYRTYRTHHNRDPIEAHPRYGMSYFSYHTEFYTIYWEAFVTLRKVLIGAAVVYAYHLGPNLQSVLALGVLFLALFFQLLFRPYRDIRTKKCGGFLSDWRLMEVMNLNHLEALSILMSAITFYSGIVFHDENTSEGGTLAMTIFVVVSNGSYFLLMLLRLWGGLHVALDEKIKFLTEEGSDSDLDGGRRMPWITKLSINDYDVRLSWVTKIALLVNYYTTNISTRLRNTNSSQPFRGQQKPQEQLPNESTESEERPPPETA